MIPPFETSSQSITEPTSCVCCVLHPCMNEGTGTVIKRRTSLHNAPYPPTSNAIYYYTSEATSNLCPYTCIRLRWGKSSLLQGPTAAHTHQQTVHVATVYL